MFKSPMEGNELNIMMQSSSLLLECKLHSMFVKNQNMQHVNCGHLLLSLTCMFHIEHAVEPKCSVPIPVQYRLVF